MSWTGVEFPRRISFGLMCQPGWNVTVISLTAGSENRNLNWSDAKHTYDASLAVRTQTDYVTVLTHFHQARGRTHTWPLRDPVDHRCEQSEGVVLQDGDDSPQGIRLHKRYGLGDFKYDRKITRPKQGTVAVYLDGLPKTEGVHWTLDYSTGLLTYSSGVATTRLTWSGEFYVPCRYDVDKLPAQVIDKHAGADGELLVSVNGLSIVEVKE